MNEQAHTAGARSANFICESFMLMVELTVYYSEICAFAKYKAFKIPCFS